MKPDRRPCICKGWLTVTEPGDEAIVAEVRAHNRTPSHVAWRAQHEPPIPVVVPVLTPAEVAHELVGTRPRKPKHEAQGSAEVERYLTDNDPETSGRVA